MKNILVWMTIMLSLTGITIGFRYIAEFHNVIYCIIAIVLMIIYPFSLYYPNRKIK